MLTSDAKPDPPRTEINSADSVLNIHSNFQCIPENTPKIDSHISSILDTSFMQKQKNLIRRSKFFPWITGNSGSISDKESSKMVNRSKNTYKHVDNSMNFNIINCNGVKIGATTKYICNFNHSKKGLQNVDSKNDALKICASKKMPYTIKKLSTSQHELTTQDMYVIKTHIGNSWREIFSSLGYSNGQLDQFLENHKSKGIGEVIYQMLLDWKYANGRKASIGNIIKILWTHKEYDCVGRLVSVKLQDNPC